MKSFFGTTLAALGFAAALAPTTAGAQGGGDNFIGQMLTVGFNFCPRGWVIAEGQILPINQNQSLYSLLGTTYGGDGRTSFALPDLRSRVNIGLGNGPGLTPRTWGQKGGAETVTLTTAELAAHNHTAVMKGTSNAANAGVGTGNLLASAPNYSLLGGADTVMKTGTVTTGNIGSGQAFSIVMPYQTILTCIALQGLFPSRN
jgi:microcystin-dependent protein